MFSICQSSFSKLIAAAAVLVAFATICPAGADDQPQSLGPVGPWSPHGSGITSANSTSRQSGPLEIVTSDVGGNFATASAGELGLATTGDVSNMQSQINHLGRRVTQANRPLPGGYNTGAR
jgi:hypothetical protein